MTDSPYSPHVVAAIAAQMSELPLDFLHALNNKIGTVMEDPTIASNDIRGDTKVTDEESIRMTLDAAKQLRSMLDAEIAKRTKGLN